MMRVVIDKDEDDEDGDENVNEGDGNEEEERFLTGWLVDGDGDCDGD